jgi:hypothetical protein
MGWRVGRCRNIQISELISMETCDQAVIDFLPATDVGKFQTSVLYGGVRSSSRVCAGVCEGVSIVSCNETCRIDIRSIDD